MIVTEYNVGRWCLSEDDCIAAGIDFAAYERGVDDAAKAFGRNTASEQGGRHCQIVIPAGTVCVVAGLPLTFTSDTPVEGEPEELAMLLSRLYPPPADDAAALSSLESAKSGEVG